MADVDGGTGMIPSRTLRAAIAEPAGDARQAAFGDAYATRPEQLLADMRWRAHCDPSVPTGDDD